MGYDLKEAMDFLVTLNDEARKPHITEIAGKTYCDKNLVRYGKEEMASPLTATSLNSLIDYINEKQDEFRESMIIHVESPTKVRLLSRLTKKEIERAVHCNNKSVRISV